MLYLDNGATSFKKPICVYETFFYNTLFNSANAGRGGHKPSLKALRGILDAQEQAAKLFNVDNPLNIAFGQNATYALNLAINGVLYNGGHIVVTQMDHNSVLRPAFLNGNYTIVKADKSGYVNPKDVESAIRPDTKLITITHASNVCGTIEPVKEIGEIGKRHKILFLIDAAQTAGSVEIDARAMNADFIAFSGHKGLMGPLGTGGLYVKNPDTISPVITGGTGSQSESLEQPGFMPDKLYAGTINAPAVTALGRAIEFINREGVKAIGERERELANIFRSELLNMENISVYGRRFSTGTAAFNISGLGSEETAELLGRNIVVRAGYHCAPLAHKALGTEATGAVRVSFGYFNKKKDVKKIIDSIWKLNKTYKG